MNTKKEIDLIKERNARVEIDKAWETSWVRRGIIAILTYLVIVLFFFSAGLPNQFVNALVPTAGFLLSTLSLGVVKKIWLERIYKK
ncbi:MAG: hypothetical protein WCW13_05525 [archaeon]|jgi:hypothetical protein